MVWSKQPAFIDAWEAEYLSDTVLIKFKLNVPRCDNVLTFVLTYGFELFPKGFNSGENLPNPTIFSP